MIKRIVFMGTPDFAVASLSKILDSNVQVAAVVTAPDRPAGRGQKLKQSAVKEFALKHEILVLQPEKLKADAFVRELQEINADLFVVVAFRMLPALVWQMPRLGTINLHGSLLPKYRGAAPINWAVINGDAETGVTTFFIEQQIDTGQIIDSASTVITKNDTGGSVHDRLMVIGADLIVRTVHDIFDGKATKKPQPESEVSHAPKIFKSDCKIDWSNHAIDIFNKIRGLSPYPTAFTSITDGNVNKTLKLFMVDYIVDSTNNVAKLKLEDDKLWFGCANGWLQIMELQLEGKKRMPTSDFLKGFNILEWHPV
ncbi:MAG: methionyl-tRNA formyltransferase [Crocinitomicaceae bacterium]